MLQNQKNVFWEALIITVFIFGVGILIGVFIEDSRAKEVSTMYLKSEVSLLDVKVQTEMLNLQDIKCKDAIEENIKFGDQIYKDAEILQQYENANRITSSLIEEHRKYDLLRALFWVNSIKIKEKCGAQFHTLAYLYDYNSEDNQENSRQYVFSKFLEDVKTKYGNKVILIPIAKNVNLTAVDFLMRTYNITQTSVILDEKMVVTNLSSLSQIEDKIK